MYFNFEMGAHGVLAIFLLAVQQSTRPFNGDTRVDKTTDMTGQNVIVTGINTGIGKQTALQLAQRGATVIITCRRREVAQSMESLGEKFCEVDRYTVQVSAVLGRQ
jgi:NADPH:quinone reductase-like Zn-dependent oxidoreductase